MKKEAPSSTRYFQDDYEVDILSGSSHALAAKLIGKNKKILEIGTSTGPLTKILSSHGNTIIGIEIDPEAAEKAGQFCEKMIVADVETINFADFFEKGEFDCIVMTDLLEHVKWPEKILKNIRSYLSKNGFLVISIPNICHGDVILNMLKGDFQYREMGLLDLTHIRFFALKNIIELFSKEHYRITDLRRVKMKIGETELKIQEEIPQIIYSLLHAVPESDTYQYIFKAEPVDTAQTLIISSSLNQVVLEAEIELEAVISRFKKEKDALKSENYVLKSEKDVLKSEKDALKSEISSLTDRLHIQKAEQQALQKQFQKQSIELVSMKQSIVWQSLMKFQKFIEITLPNGTKRRKLYDLGLKSGRIMINEGPGSFFSAVRRFQEDRKLKSNIFQSRKFTSPKEETFTISPFEFLPLNDIRIAVHVHVYYIDLFEEILTYLKNIPIKYSLFVSISNDEHKEIVQESLKKILNVEKTEIRVVSNRGRDIAPFLIEFGPLLKNFDYICHIHTKKSVYTGGEKKEWRQYLLDGLLGSGDIVHAILTAFEKDSSIGIVYPEIYPYMPYWACTWLSNKHIAPAILNKLHIRFDRDEYFDYPVGSMFWIRKESLEPLLNLKLKLSDFPEELGQTDGTLQHTLERCFVLAAKSQGYNHLVIRDPTTYLFSYRSNRNIHQYITAQFEQKFIRCMGDSEVLSFDIFDTLLYRPFANPDKVFDYLEEIIEKEIGITHYKQLRLEAESIVRARKNHLGDVKISEIYSVFSDRAKIDPKTADALLNLEVNTEKKLLIPRKEVIELAKSAKKLGKRLILVSDTYLERRYVEDILLSKNIDFFDEIYLSCEIGKRKDRGDLWDYVFESEGVGPSYFMHVGDNEESDIQRISDRGFKNYIHIMRPSLFFRHGNLGMELWKQMEPYSGWRENLLFGMIANRLCSNPNEKDLLYSKKPFEDPYITGYIVFGPIIFNFMNWLIKQSRKDECQQLWFMAREGYFLNSIFEMMFNHPNLQNVKEHIPNNTYFLCSRRCAVFASLKTEKDIAQLMEGNYRGSLRDFFTKRLVTRNIAEIESRLGSRTLDQQVTLSNDYNRIYECINQVIDILVKEANSERELLIQYCTDQGNDRSRKISIVDLGYSGTMQYALTKLLNYPINGYYFITTSSALRLSSLGSACKAYFGEFIDLDDMTIPIYKYSLLMESILTAPDGQLVRFESDGLNILHPVFKDQALSQKEFHAINQINEGILSFIRELIEEFGPHALDIEFPKDLVQICYELVIRGGIDIGSLDSILSVEDEYSGNEELSPLAFYRKRYAREMYN